MAKKCSYDDCKGSSTMAKFCRLHYIATWKDRQKSKEKKLNQYIERITKKYPSQYLEVIKKDLSSSENFKKAVDELDIENVEEEDIDDFIKKVGKE